MSDLSRKRLNLLENIACLVSFRPDLGARTEYSIKIKLYYSKVISFRGLRVSEKIEALLTVISF